MGLLSEATIQLPYFVKGSFNSTDADSAHKLTKMEAEIDGILPQIYSQGVNPKMYDVSLSITQNSGYFTTTYGVRIDKSDDGKAWMGFASRGSIGGGYEQRADGQISGTENKDGKSLEKKLKGIGAIEIIPIEPSPIINRKSPPFKQYFFQFTKQKYPPIGSQSKSNVSGNLPKKQIKGTSFSDLRTKLQDQTKKISINPQSVNINIDNLEVTYEDGNQIIEVISFIWDDKGQLNNRLDSLKISNPTMKVLKTGKNQGLDWALSIIF